MGTSKAARERSWQSCFGDPNMSKFIENEKVIERGDVPVGGDEKNEAAIAVK